MVVIEPDPLEALKVGTYVGSCIGRGGRLEYSAAAVVLDVNVGRQLLAISEADELVCFRVYGTANAKLLEPLFRDYDKKLAARLGLELYGERDPDAEYEIPHILSREWWDDSAWVEAAE